MDLASAAPLERENFSLNLGGPFQRLLVRARLVRAPLEALHRWVFVCAAVTWLPPAALCLAAGTFAGGVGLPFLDDIDAHVRFLIAVPLLIGAELFAHRRIRTIVNQFPERGLIAAEELPQFDDIVAGALRWRNSAVVEAALLVFSFTGGYWIWRAQEAPKADTWYAASADGSAEFTAAGIWYAFVSLPLARFILLRWYYRLLIWHVFLWRVSRLRLNLNGLHPDRAGGLGFLEQSVTAFAPVLIAQSAFLAGVIATRICHSGAALTDFKVEIAGFTAILILLVLLPMTFFALPLTEARRTTLRRYGAFAAGYVAEFRRKWLDGGAGGTALGSGDIQSLADLANSFQVVREVRTFPFDWKLVLRVAVLIAIPLLPLLLTMFPLEELLLRLIRLLT